jgi:opacity protein-like surface antigen
MRGANALIVGLIGASALVAGAQAADMPRNYPPAPEYQDYVPQYRELMSGWYLRGDIGYRLNSMGSVETTDPATDFKYPNTLSGTFGFGFKYQWFRSDLTLDYAWPAKAYANTATAAVQPQYASKIDATSLLANAYIDFGTWGGFTPYVGAGAGLTYLRGKVYVDTTLPTNLDPVGTRTNFSWAWMAGVSYRIKPNWTVDVGFRHLDLGDVSTSTGTATDGTTWKNLSANEVRFGLRYLFD